MPAGILSTFAGSFSGGVVYEKLLSNFGWLFGFFPNIESLEPRVRAHLMREIRTTGPKYKRCFSKKHIMRKLLLALFLLPFSLFAQIFPVDTDSGKITYTEEILVKDASQSELYNRAKTWFFASTKDNQALQVDDAANGLLIGNRYSPLVIKDGEKTETRKLWYTIKIRVEDDFLWYSMTDFQLQGGSTPQELSSKEVQTMKHPLELFVFSQNASAKKGNTESFNKELNDKINESILDLIKDFKTNML